MVNRCSGTMTESQYLAFIRSALRSKWLRWKPRSDAIKLGQKPYEGDNKRQKWVYECAICKEELLSKDLEVDHFPKDAGSILSVDDIGEFCNNLFCEVDNLRLVHKECHKTYTHSQKKGITFEEAELEKYIINLLRVEQKSDIILFIESWDFNGEYLTGNEAQRRKALVEIFRNFYKGE